MEPLLIFSPTDNSIDIIGAVVFAFALGHSVRYIILNNLNRPSQIIYGFIIVLSALHIFQVDHQLFSGGPSLFTIRLWDFINYLTAVLFLIGAHRVYQTKNNV